MCVIYDTHLRKHGWGSRPSSFPAAGRIPQLFQLSTEGERSECVPVSVRLCPGEGARSAPEQASGVPRHREAECRSDPRSPPPALSGAPTRARADRRSGPRQPGRLSFQPEVALARRAPGVAGRRSPAAAGLPLPAPRRLVGRGRAERCPGPASARRPDQGDARAARVGADPDFGEGGAPGRGRGAAAAEPKRAERREEGEEERAREAALAGDAAAAAAARWSPSRPAARPSVAEAAAPCAGEVAGAVRAGEWGAGPGGQGVAPGGPRRLPEPVRLRERRPGEPGAGPDRPASAPARSARRDPRGNGAAPAGRGRMTGFDLAGGLGERARTSHRALTCRHARGAVRPPGPRSWTRRPQGWPLDLF